MARATAAEAISQVLLLEALQETSDKLALEVVVEVGTAGRKVRRRIAQLSEVLDERLRRVTLESREHAKSLARGQVSFELGRIAARHEGTAPALPAVGSVEVDLFEANRAAGSLRAAWASAADGQFRAWERAGTSEAQLVGYLRAAAERLTARVENHASWQAMEAYNREQADTWALLAGSGGTDLIETEPLLPQGWEGNLFRVWSAILDRKTCPVCSGLDGTIVPLGKAFAAGDPPAHNRCRCIVVTIEIPDERQLRKLPGIALDYAQLKADIREHFQRSRLTDLVGLRHAEDFIRESLKTSSPEALTRRLAGPRKFIQKGLRRRPRVRPLQF